MTDQQESDLPPGLSKPALRALTAAGYLRLEQFTQLSEADVHKLHGMGPKALDLIRRALAADGKSFRVCGRSPSSATAIEGGVSDDR